MFFIQKRSYLNFLKHKVLIVYDSRFLSNFFFQYSISIALQYWTWIFFCSVFQDLNSVYRKRMLELWNFLSDENWSTVFIISVNLFLCSMDLIIDPCQISKFLIMFFPFYIMTKTNHEYWTLHKNVKFM